MSIISDSLKRIKPSPTIAVTQKARELRAAGKDVIGLGAGEPDFDTPDNIKDAAIKAIKKGDTKYTAVDGTPILKQAIVDKFKRENNLNYTTAQITVGAGGKHVIYNLMMATLNKGDEVIIPAPYWVSYPDIVLLAGATPIVVECSEEQGFKLTAKDLEAAITNNTKWVILNSPSNPTGGVWSDQAIYQLLDLCKKRKDIWIFSDECYEQLTYNQKFKSIASYTAENNNIITFQSCSKTYAMTGWRIGYIGANVKISKAISKLQGQSTSCPNSIAQYAASEALLGDQSCVEKMRSVFLNRRDLILSKIKEMPHAVCQTPQGAFYVFVDFSYYLNSKQKNGDLIKNSNDLCLYLLESTGVVSVSGDSFGADGYIRFSYATSNEIIVKAMNLTKKALKNLSF